LCFALLSLNTTSAVGEVVGRTVAAADLVQNYSAGQVSKVAASSKILLNDRLKANASGNAQIELVDGTKVVVGPGADLTIDKFAFANNGTLKQLTVKATKGAFRFISGHSDHSAYAIRTPSGTIGVRGTALDVTVVKGGTYVALLQGAINVCDNSRRCRVLDNPCDYIFVGRRGLGGTGRISSNGRTDKARQPFPLLASQSQLMPQFRRFATGCSARNINSFGFAAVTPPAGTFPAFTSPTFTQPSQISAFEPQISFAGPGNPGNGKAVGGAGESPNGGNFGGTSNGHSDANDSTNPGKSASANGHNK